MTTREPPSIWWWAFGYFACYVPYTALTKMLSNGLIDVGGSGRVGGIEILPVSVIATVLTMVVFLAATGWWRHAGRRTIAGVSLPLPGKLTFLSGLCASGIIATTTLSYTFKGASIVFMMLLMRGGVLVMAPLVDAVSGRHVRWFSWAALGLTIGALVVSVVGDDGRGGGISFLLGLDVVCYLGFYFVRLSLMSRLAKSHEPGANLRYFVEEAMVSAPALLLALVIGALTLGGQAGAELRAGFTTMWDRPVLWHALAIGVFSQGTGICGGLIFLDTRENTFCVPVNRASSVLAGLVASFWLSLQFAGYPPVPGNELAGAVIIIAAIGFLSIPPAMAKRRAARAAAAALPAARALE